MILAEREKTAMGLFPQGHSGNGRCKSHLHSMFIYYHIFTIA
jgi:hypothetical protein